MNPKQAKASGFYKDISQVPSFKTRSIILMSKDQSVFSETEEYVAYKNMLLKWILI